MSTKHVNYIEGIRRTCVRLYQFECSHYHKIAKFANELQ